VTITAPGRLTRTSPDLPQDLYGYAAMHHGMDRDAARLVSALTAAPRNAAALVRWWSQFRDVIGRHHVREDDLLWPVLAAADPTFSDEVATMHDDHDELDTAMERLDVALRALSGGPDTLAEARTAAQRFRLVLLDHLAREEEVAFHRIAQRPQMWAEIERQIDDAVRVREAAFEFPWVLDELDHTRADLLMQRVPRMFLPVARHLWQPRYRRLVAAALETEETR
jgi:hemerythrin-like domain-containing protein